MAASFPNDAGAYQGEAEAALAPIELYLSPDGLWSDRLDELGNASAGVAIPQALYAPLSAVQSLAISFEAGETFDPTLTVS